MTTGPNLKQSPDIGPKGLVWIIAVFWIATTTPFQMVQSAATETNMARVFAEAIKIQENTPCHWVDKVGENAPGKTVEIVETGHLCINQSAPSEAGDKTPTSIICRGIIKCSHPGWGDIFFEGVHCPGTIDQDKKVKCGIKKNEEKDGTFETSIKLCLSNFLHSNPKTEELDTSGYKHRVAPPPWQRKTLETSQ